MTDAPTILLKRLQLTIDDKTKLDYVSCPDLGLYLCYKDARLTYRLIEPLARFLMWANRQTNVRPQTLDYSVLKERNVMMVGFEVLAGEPRLDPTLDELEKYGMLGQPDAVERCIYLPYADERLGEELFMEPVILQIRAEDPLTPR